MRGINRLIVSEKYKERILNDLKRRKLIYVFHKDKQRSFRLSALAKELLLKANNYRFSFYLTGDTETNHLKSEITRRLRLHRLAETYITMHNAGIAIFRDEKPDMFHPVNLQTVTNPCFYNSREIKEIGIESTKIRGSRATGVMLTATNAYIVYNAGGHLLKWDYNAETRMRAFMQTVLCRDRGLYKFDSVGTIMLGDDMQLAHEMLVCASGMNGNYLSLNRENTSFYYAPNNPQGETLIKFLCSSEIKALINDRLSDGLCERSPSMRFENDALDMDGNYVLFAYDFDMPRIIRFNNALHLYEKTGTIICFDFQADVLRSYCHSSIQIRTIDYESLKRRFFP